MEFAINCRGLEGQNLVVKPAGFFGAKLLQNGKVLKGQRNVYKLKNNAGAPVIIQLKPVFLDPVPKVFVDKSLIRLAEPFKWYEYLWIGLPLCLVIAGRLLGALPGIFALYANGRVFRSKRGTFAKYFLTGLVSVGSVIVFLILAMILVTILGQ
jgi:hypothetical protein